MSALDDALWPRAALPRRPMLGAVLDALTVPGAGDPPPSFWCATGLPTTMIDRGNVIVVGSPYLTVRYPWVTLDPAEAWELLQARGRIPMDCRSRFVCGPCAERPGVDCIGCFDCHGTGTLPHPPTVAALASWASLGWAAGDDGAPGILGAEELAAAMSPDAPPRWRVAPTGADTTDGSSRAEMAALRLLLAGFGWQHRAGRVTLIVPPLGLVTS